MGLLIYRATADEADAWRAKTLKIYATVNTVENLRETGQGVFAEAERESKSGNRRRLRGVVRGFGGEGSSGGPWGYCELCAARVGGGQQGSFSGKSPEEKGAVGGSGGSFWG